MTLSLHKRSTCARLFAADSESWPVNQWGDIEDLDCDCEGCRSYEYVANSRSWKERIELAEHFDGGGYEIDVNENTGPDFVCSMFILSTDGDQLGDIIGESAPHNSILYFSDSGEDWPEYGPEGRILHRAFEINDGGAHCNCGGTCGDNWHPGTWRDQDDVAHVCPRCAGRGTVDRPAYSIGVYGPIGAIRDATIEAIEAELQERIEESLQTQEYGGEPSKVIEWWESTGAVLRGKGTDLYAVQAFPWASKVPVPACAYSALRVSDAFLVATEHEGTWAVRVTRFQNFDQA